MNENKNIIDVSESEFNEQVVEASVNKLIVVDFWAPWCGPCKQLTPVLEKVINNSQDKVLLVKINIDENQQIASQLRIQSIPTVYAFKDKQIVNAFQGVLTEKQVVDFVEKCLGSKLTEDNNEFYEQIEKLMLENKFEESKDALLEFISNNSSNDTTAIKLYLSCLVELKQFDEFETFVNSLEAEIQKDEGIQQIVQRLKIIKDNSSGPKIEDLINDLKKKPNDIDLIIKTSDKYFSLKEYDKCMELLLNNYPKSKNKIKEKMVNFFNVLGDKHECTVSFRKKLSQIMFS
tara:strand:- start:399 stop:1268 length:870 start_codon:yes stop_codon:yes gene_type:complete